MFNVPFHLITCVSCTYQCRGHGQFVSISVGTVSWYIVPQKCSHTRFASKFGIHHITVIQLANSAINCLVIECKVAFLVVPWSFNSGCFFSASVRMPPQSLGPQEHFHTSLVSMMAIGKSQISHQVPLLANITHWRQACYFSLSFYKTS